MFHTFNHAKIPLPLSTPGESAWAYLELMVNSYFFFADCLITEDAIGISTSYILSSPGQLTELSTNKNVSIKGVYVVSPPHMNLSDSWKMDRVAQVSSGVTIEDDYTMKIEIYELNSGAKYYSTDLSGKENNIEDIKVIFSV